MYFILNIDLIHYIDDQSREDRQISREIGITTLTVKARFERLLNIGFIKGDSSSI
jgi:DNA-binding Lrp family transcriptional regulator